MSTTEIANLYNLGRSTIAKYATSFRKGFIVLPGPGNPRNFILDSEKEKLKEAIRDGPDSKRKGSIRNTMKLKAVSTHLRTALTATNRARGKCTLNRKISAK